MISAFSFPNYGSLLVGTSLYTEISVYIGNFWLKTREFLDTMQTCSTDSSRKISPTDHSAMHEGMKKMGTSCISITQLKIVKKIRQHT